MNERTKTRKNRLIRNFTVGLFGYAIIFALFPLMVYLSARFYIEYEMNLVLMFYGLLGGIFTRTGFDSALLLAAQGDLPVQITLFDSSLIFFCLFICAALILRRIAPAKRIASLAVALPLLYAGGIIRLLIIWGRMASAGSEGVLFFDEIGGVILGFFLVILSFIVFAYVLISPGHGSTGRGTQTIEPAQARSTESPLPESTGALSKYVWVGIAALIVYLLLVGFSGLIPDVSPPEPGKTDVPTTTIVTPVATPTAPSPEMQESSVSTLPLPGGRKVTVEIPEKDAVHHTIKVKLLGGDYRVVLERIWVEVATGDGSTYGGDLPLRDGSEIVLPGTPGTDHVDVYAILYSGGTHLIASRDLPATLV
jgi:hypothetical protein